MPGGALIRGNARRFQQDLTPLTVAALRAEQVGLVQIGD